MQVYDGGSNCAGCLIADTLCSQHVQRALGDKAGTSFYMDNTDLII